jgi:excisionase family DNA binding protein
MPGGRPHQLEMPLLTFATATPPDSGLPDTSGPHVVGIPNGHPHREPATQGDVLTAKEVADYLQIPVRSVHEYAARGELPSVRIGRHRRFSRAAVEAVVERG